MNTVQIVCIGLFAAWWLYEIIKMICDTFVACSVARYCSFWKKPNLRRGANRYIDVEKKPPVIKATPEATMNLESDKSETLV